VAQSALIESTAKLTSLPDERGRGALNVISWLVKAMLEQMPEEEVETDVAIEDEW
jgi:hypothetical protein